VQVGYEGGWVTIAVGTHTVVFDELARKVVHKCRPWVFSHAKSESDATLHGIVLPSIIRLVEELAALRPEDSPLGKLLPEDATFNLGTGLSDRAASMANMFNAAGESSDAKIQAATAEMVYLQCWPHLSTKVIHDHTLTTDN
jgi:hypothetical protein